MDTAIAKEWPNHDVLDVPKADWNYDLNDAWVNEGIQNKQTFYLASLQTPENMWNDFYNSESVYARELGMLKKAGYIQKGDYLIPPK